MKIVNVHEAKTQLSKLLESVESGEEIVIARAGVPAARLIPVSEAVRRPGRLRDVIRIAADFDAPLPPELAEAFGADSE